MNEPPVPPSSPPPPAGANPSPSPKPKDRRWFIMLTWLTLVLFGIFVAGITLVTATIPQIKKAREAAR
jgi:predicted secreted protein